MPLVAKRPSRAPVAPPKKRKCDIDVKTLPKDTAMQQVINKMLHKLSSKDLARAAAFVQKMGHIKVVSLCSGSELQGCPFRE